MKKHTFNEIKHDLNLIRQLGHQFIIPSRRQEWDEFCDQYNEADLSELELLAQIACIMEQLKFSFDNDANYWAAGWSSIYDQAQKEISHSCNSWNYVLMNVAQFSPFGVHYVSREKVSHIHNPSDEMIKLLLKLKRENTEMLSTENKQKSSRKQ